MLADAGHSAGDLVSDFVTLATLKFARRPVCRSSFSKRRLIVSKSVREMHNIHMDMASLKVLVH